MNVSLKLLSIVSLRALAIVMSLQGQSKAAQALNLLVSRIESGRNVDLHMEQVAIALNGGTEATWDDILSRIESETSKFLSRGPDGQAPPDDPPQE